MWFLLERPYAQDAAASTNVDIEEVIYATTKAQGRHTTDKTGKRRKSDKGRQTTAEARRGRADSGRRGARRGRAQTADDEKTKNKKQKARFEEAYVNLRKALASLIQSSQSRKGRL